MSTRLTRREFVGAATAASLPLITGLPSLAGAERATEAVVAPTPSLAPDAMDHDMLEITVDGLHALYDAKKYTVTEVTKYYLARIARYNPVYRAILHTDTAGALKTAAAQDAAAKAGGARFKRTALWGVPIVIKANTSVKGMVTSAGWSGYLIPGLELIAPQDAPVVAKLRAAGAVILGHTNMPDFAASDTNMSTAFGRTGNAYNPRFSPGGSSGGTVTAVTANLCVLGTGTDTANSIRMPAATSCVVGVLPTRGLVSIAGIQPLDWLRDNTGPIARDVRDTAIALTVMAGEDSKDFQTKGSAAQAEAGPYTNYLKSDAIKGKRFGVPAFMMTPAAPGGGGGGTPLQPETREQFMKALDELRNAGATVVIDDNLLPSSFAALARMVGTRPYTAEGTELFLKDFGPPEYHSIEEYEQVMGTPMPGTVTGIQAGGGRGGRAGAPGAPTPPAAPAGPKQLETDPAADSTYFAPQRAAVAAYNAALDQFKLDGLVYPAIQMPPNDEIAALANGGRSSGPHSDTGWVNDIGVPAISVPAGFYDSGLPFNLEFSAKRWRDGDLIGWVYSFEQATHARKPPVLQENSNHRRAASTP
ncbi:MAG TPA: amidase [Gemmatimonadaceae bacterium]